MKLMTKEIEKKLDKTPIYSQKDKGFDAEVLVKFFDPCGRYTLFVTEGERQADGDWHFFGYVVSALGEDCDEWGYAVFSEIASVRNRFHLGFERDMHFEGTVREGLKQLGLNVE